MHNFSLLSAYFDRVPHENGNKYYLYEEVWTEYATAALSTVFMYVAIALAVILIGIGIFVRLKKPERFSAFFRTGATVAVTFALTVTVTMLTLGFAKISEKGYAEGENMLLELVPPLVLGGVIVIGIIACYASHFFAPKTFKITLISTLSCIGSAFVATVVCLIVFFTKNIKNDGYYGEEINQLALYLSSVGLIAVIVGTAVVADLKNKTAFDSRCIALAGICVALSFALSYIKMFSMPQGGSVTLASLLPVMLFSYVYGAKKGVFVGCIYGALQAMQNPWLIHPAQFLLDYPVAFASAGLAGAFKKITQLDKLPQIKFALGAVAASALRFTAHVFSGVFAFGADAGGDSLWLYSLGYNSYVFVDIAIVIAAGVLILSSKNFVKRIDLYAKVKKQPVIETEDKPTETEEN